MNIINSRFYRILEVVSNFFLLNILWILMCIPIITIFPATVAMFAVLREWIMNKENGVFRSYFRFFKENFKLCSIVGMLWVIVITILYVDYQLISQFNPVMHMIFTSLLFVLALLTLFVTIYLFPVMVHYQLPIRGIIKNSFFMSIMAFPTTIVSVILLVGMYTALLMFPVSFLVIFSFGAYLILALCYRNFRKIENLAKINDEDEEEPEQEEDQRQGQVN